MEYLLLILTPLAVLAVLAMAVWVSSERSKAENYRLERDEVWDLAFKRGELVEQLRIQLSDANIRVETAERLADEFQRQSALSIAAEQELRRQVDELQSRISIASL